MGGRQAPLARGRGAGERLQAVEVQIRQEKAGALGRAGERLEEALRRLDRVRRAVELIEARLRDPGLSAEDAAVLQQARMTLTARRAMLRDRASVAHQYLVIQREAVGVRDHLDIERCFRISERLR
jgi:hypothetical protein